MERFDIGVVGGGVMGLSVLRAAARRGHSAVLFERYPASHPYGASHGPARAFAVPHRQLELIAMATKALPLWRELAEDNAELFWDQGVMLRAMDDHDEVCAAMRDAGAPFEDLDAPAVLDRHGVSLPAGARVVYTPSGGTIRADLALEVLGASAAAHGGVARRETPVRGIAADGAGVVLSSTGGDVRVGHAVVAAGAWSGELLSPIGIDIPVRASRQTVGYFRYPKAAALPGLYEALGPAMYWVSSDESTVRVGEHNEDAEPPDLGSTGTPDGPTLERLSAHVRSRLPDADATPLRAETCLYTHTGGRFVIEHHGRVTAAVACEGRGFKFAPYLGERIVADIEGREQA